MYMCFSDAGVEGAAVIKKKRIRRQSLRYFYGNSVSSPNLTEVPSSVIKVRRSPRLLGERSTCCVCLDLAGCINLHVHVCVQYSYIVHVHNNISALGATYMYMYMCKLVIMYSCTCTCTDVIQLSLLYPVYCTCL